MKPLFLLGLAALPAFAAFPNGYSYCKIVTTQHTMVSGASDLANYPLTVILTEGDLRTVANGGLVNSNSGYDIGFYPDCSGSGTALKWEMESYSPTTGAIVAHVLRPTLSRAANDSIGMFYGGSYLSFQSTATAVWDANYKGVYHLADNAASANVADSTANFGGTAQSNTSGKATGGKLGGALTFNGSTDYVKLGGALNYERTQAFSISLWIKTSTPGYIALFARGSNAPPNYEGIHLFSNTSNKLEFSLANSFPSKTAQRTGLTAINDNTWRYVVATYDGSSTGAGMHVYVNGVNDDGAIPLNSLSASMLTAKSAEIGGRDGNNYNWNGPLDEVRLSNIARSADWILTEYRNQSAPGTYLSVGPRLTAGTSVRVRHSVTGGI